MNSNGRTQASRWPRQLSRSSFVLAVASLVAVSAISAFAQQTTSPGKNSVAVSSGDVLGESVPITGQLSKAGAKRILLVNATYEVGINLSGGTVRYKNLFLSLFVNNGVVAVQPVTTLVGTCRDDIPLACTITGAFWVDLDAAEAANPGAVIKHPLDIEVDGSATTNNGTDPVGRISFTAQLIKK